MVRDESGRRRAALLMVALGPDRAAEILKHLPEDDIQALAWEIAGVGQLTPEQREDILATFYETALGRDYVSIGGLEYAQTTLERALGKERADEIVAHLGSTAQHRPFSFFRDIDMKDVSHLLSEEHPQVIALLLAALNETHGSELLHSLPDQLQAEVVIRLGLMEQVTPEVVRKVEDLLYARLGGIFGGPNALNESPGGIDTVVDILRGLDLRTEAAVLESMDAIDAPTANDVRRRMLVFDNLVLLDDRSVQLVLRQIDGGDLALALKGANDDVRDAIVRNMSERAALVLRDDMEVLGPVRLAKVEEARSRIVATIRQLEEAEEIFVMRGGDEELIA